MIGEPYLGNREAITMPKPWVKWSCEPTRAQDVPEAFMRAYAMARQPPAGPVYLSIPMDDWKQSLDGYARVRTVSDRVAPDAERLWLFAGRISASRRPALVFGPEVDRGGGWDAAIALAEKLRAAVYGAPLLDRASFPEDHPLFRGPLGMSVRTVSDRHGTAADHRRPRGRRGRAGGRQPAGRPQAGDRPAPGPGHGGLGPDRPGADGPAPPASAGTEQPADPARGLRRAEPGQAARCGHRQRIDLHHGPADRVASHGQDRIVLRHRQRGYRLGRPGRGRSRAG